MNWFRRYHANLRKRIEEGAPYGGSTKLDALWLFILGMGVFVLIDVGLGERERLFALVAAAVSGAIWLGYVTMLDIKGLQSWLRRRSMQRGELED